ncbi:MAG: TolC family protein [Bdellovibrionota bacterium]
MRFFYLFLFLSLPGHAAISLKEAFDSARLNMENLKRSEALRDAAEERKDRARGFMLPTVRGVGNETRIDKPSASGVNQAFVLTRQYSAAIRLEQPLLRGGILGGYDFAKDDLLLAEFQKNATEITLYQLVINSYYNLMMARFDLENLKELSRLSENRVKELRSRTSVGRSRKGELVQAEAQLLTAQTSMKQGDINLIEAERSFEYFTGTKAGELAPLSLMPTDPGALEAHLQKLKQRPDIQAALQQVKLRDSQVTIAKGAHYPQLDFVGNYYFDRTGVLQTSEWDAAVQVSVPIFEGGRSQAAVREAVENRKVAELDSRQTVRAAERDLTILYQNFIASLSQLETMKDALKKAEEGYKLNLRDYSYGQATNLDVLQSLNLFIETKRSYDSLQASAHMTYKNLEASTGVLP